MFVIDFEDQNQQGTIGTSQYIRIYNTFLDKKLLSMKSYLQTMILAASLEEQPRQLSDRSMWYEEIEHKSRFAQDNKNEHMIFVSLWHIFVLHLGKLAIVCIRMWSILRYALIHWLQSIRHTDCGWNDIVSTRHNFWENRLVNLNTDSSQSKITPFGDQLHSNKDCIMSLSLSYFYWRDSSKTETTMFWTWEGSTGSVTTSEGTPWLFMSVSNEETWSWLALLPLVSRNPSYLPC